MDFFFTKAICPKFRNLVCFQEMDILENQRNLEFELRQLMLKPDDEKTEYDAHREEELLGEILNMVQKRSNIVEQMDQDRLR